MDKKEAYIEKIEAQLREWSSRIDELKARAEAAKADGRLIYEKKIVELREKQEELRSKLQKMRTSGEGAWQDLKEGLEKARDELKRAVSASLEKFQGKATKTTKGKGAGRMVKFVYHGEARKVCIAGEFNNWDRESLPMKRAKDGTWAKTIRLAPGRYEYNLVVDGEWVEDTTCKETKLNPFGTRNCIVTVV
jgi:hypothetical protein